MGAEVCVYFSRDQNKRTMTPVIVVVMGVTGCGKSTVGSELAKLEGWPFEDGDDLHPAANKLKMASGHPLTDADRWPWLHAVRAHIDGWVAAGSSGVIACSALKRAYRQVLDSEQAETRFAFLDVSVPAATRPPGRSGRSLHATRTAGQPARDAGATGPGRTRDHHSDHRRSRTLGHRRTDRHGAPSAAAT